MLSLLAKDEEGAPLGLWRLEPPTAAEGELELDPAALGLPEDARLYLFCEELNEAYRSNYASPLQELERKDPTPEAAAPETPEAPAIPEGGGGEESTGTIELVTPDPDHGGSGRKAGTAGKIVAAVLLGLLAVGLVSAAVRRQSIIPIVLLILLLLLAAIVDLRTGYGFFPGL